MGFPFHLASVGASHILHPTLCATHPHPHPHTLRRTSSVRDQLQGHVLAQHNRRYCVGGMRRCRWPPVHSRRAQSRRCFKHRMHTRSRIRLVIQPVLAPGLGAAGAVSCQWQQQDAAAARRVCCTTVKRSSCTRTLLRRWNKANTNNCDNHHSNGNTKKHHHYDISPDQANSNC